MKIFYSLAVSVTLISILSGCIIVTGHDSKAESWKTTQTQNRSLISDLELQSDRASIIAKLGTPNFSDAFIKGEDNYRILYYRTQHNKSDGETTKDETTPLVIKNDKLVGWGDALLNKVRQL
ncbi:MAG: hypothetical protein COA86_01745 [Kangiella sp.]|nr:MAG: hypothetical protein COA86_01745 [Kangiella sp.]